MSYLKKVYLSADVYCICLQHALTTEKQEIMGLLLGEVDDEGVSNISACKILHRSDKQPDRVEISAEQLCEAAMYAEVLQQRLNRNMRVLGWYHSHPHITVWPSHVDIRTQQLYQTMDPMFVGLIFSVYTSDTGSVGNQVQVTCFQAQGSEPNLKRREVELVIRRSPLAEHNLEAITNLPKILVQEEVGSQTEETGHKDDVLAILHNDALKTLAMGHIVSKIDIPMWLDSKAALLAAKNRVEELKKVKQELLNQLNN